MLYKSIIFPSPSLKTGGLIEHTSQLISSIISHLDIIISRSGWGSSDWWCFDLLGNHRLQVNVDPLVLEDAETALGGNTRLVHACRTKNTYRCVLDGEFFVLLKSFSKGMQAMGNELL